MPKKIQDFAKMTDAQQSDALWARAYKMPTMEAATKRAGRLCSKLSEADSKRVPFCFGTDHCKCFSCPPCRLRGQRSFVYRTLDIIDQYGGSEAWRAITIVPEFGKTELGELPKGDIRGFMNQVRAAIRKIDPDTVAAMCVDISWERKVGEKEFWQSHVHGLIWNPSEHVLDQLRDRFSWRNKSEGSCQRPVRVERLYDPVGWSGYSAKPQFKLREQRPDENGELRTVTKGLTIDQELAFVRVLSKFKANHRFFDIGLKKLK